MKVKGRFFSRYEAFDLKNFDLDKAEYSPKEKLFLDKMMNLRYAVTKAAHVYYLISNNA